MSATRYRVDATSAIPAPAIPGLVYERPLRRSRGDVEVHLYRGLQPRRHVAVTLLSRDRPGGALPDGGTVGAATVADPTLADTTLAGVRHPFIVPVLAAGVTDCGRSYLVSAHYPGPDLAARAASRGLAVEEVLKIGIQVASAVQAAHDVGIVHGHIEPACLLVDALGRPGLSGFGVAAGVRADGASTADARSDVASLGATLWQLLVGRSPFAVAAADDPSPPGTGRGDVPESLERLLARCLAATPGDRPASAAELAGSLQDIESELGLSRTEFVAPRAAPDGPEPEPEPEPESEQELEPEPEPELGSEPALPEPAGLPEVSVRRPAPAEAPPTVALIAAAAVVAVTVGVVLPFAIGHRSAAPIPTPRAATAVPAGPGPVTVRATGGRGAVGFGWTYPGALAGDSYRWRSVAGPVAGSGAVIRPALTVHGRPGTKVCLQVSVRRAGTGRATAAAPWSPTVCGVAG